MTQQIYPPRLYAFDLLQWNMRAVPYYVILGAAAGLVSASLSKAG